ncbi:methyltransferase domain-containing protein [Thermoleophilia bacterium SCSIO 60948]|nr:methyltransferase domain-containing protein [Thermoleophilia bacterium SCSIO 60948]
MSSPLDWDASAYDGASDPQEVWGREVLERLDPGPGDAVIDAGCGSGRVTRLIAERLPEGRLVAVDSSPSMVAHAREALAGAPCPDIEVVEADITHLSVAEPVDAVFSNATFHWVLDHRSLFRSLAGCLRPGGRLEAAFGAEGNISEFVRAVESLIGDERFNPYLRDATRPWNFASIADTTEWLRRGGFDVEHVWIEDRPVQPRDPKAFLAASGFASVLGPAPAEIAGDFLDAVIGSMPRPLVLDYRRLNISARRA